MRVLLRKEGEEVLVGDQIAVTVLEARNGKVRLGVRAPRATLMLRGELREERVGPIARENETVCGRRSAGTEPLADTRWITDSLSHKENADDHP